MSNREPPPAKPPPDRRRRIAWVGGAVVVGLLVFGAGLTVEAALGRLREAILTGLILFGAAVCALACTTAWGRRGWRPVVLLGWGCALGAPLACYAEFHDWRGDWDEPVEILLTLTPCFAYLCLTTLVRVRKRWRWVVRVARLAAITLTVLVVLMVLGELRVDRNVPVFLSTLTVLGCATVALAALHWHNASQARVVTAALTLRLVCPRCGLLQEMGAGRAQCRQCRLVLRIMVDEETCPACGYVLYGLTSERCPECGAAVLQPQAGAGYDA